MRKKDNTFTLKTSYDRKRVYLMFLDNLSAALLRLCNTEHLSYERAAERCQCNSRHFFNIVRRLSCPSLKIFESICFGFHQTPNSLLGVHLEELSFRIPMPVVKEYVFPLVSGTPVFPVCPQCGITLEREYMQYCSACGQHLFRKYFEITKRIIRP